MLTEEPPSPLAILCSGVALGVYVPGLILQRRLADRGLASSIYVLENVIDEPRRAKIPQTKAAFHRNFAMARMAQKMCGDISHTFDPALVAALLREWAEREIVRFCVFSGFWLPILRDYARMAEDRPLEVYLCAMDASLSTSWSPYVGELGRYRQLALHDAETRQVNYTLSINGPPVPYAARHPRYVIHGGGWGMGTYRQKIAALQRGGLAPDIVCYEANDFAGITDGSRYFLIDPSWNPWQPVEGQYCFPPFGQVLPDKPMAFVAGDHCPGVYELIAHARAIISKPGGATLLDSFAAGTPLLFLAETFGAYEAKNALLWQDLGFGMGYEAWERQGFPAEPLETMHRNLLDYRSTRGVRALDQEIGDATQNRRAV